MSTAVKKPTRFRSVRAMVKATAPKSFRDFFAKHHRREARLKAKYAKDPKHKHVKEECGSFGPVTGPRAYKDRVILYWCKVCHADLGHKITRKK